MKDKIQDAIKIIQEGGIVIYPTDTAFGIGCRMDNEESIKRLFAIRRRPETQPMSILVDTVTMAKKYVKEIPQSIVDTLIEPYWPGALTIILPANETIVPSLVRGGGKTVGVRIPNHKIARKLIQGAGVGILGPSANFHGEKTPYTYEDLSPELKKLVDYVVPGKCSVGMASTVVDCSVTPWKVLRQGTVKIHEYQKNKIILIVDTTSNQSITVGLEINGKQDTIKQVVDARKAQIVLPLLDTLLKKHKLALSDLSAISVEIGPGSFTGIRVGIAIANALAFSLGIPVNNKPIGEFVDPVY